ncbi:hypothetical protein ILUMI_25250 [Ignelater luminosus]|uniref:Protein sleepless n=1 Tax=Ignelater luminosus TaxID=2038154 RepID=A0A8K0FZV1_IGNLU|nr:hypothetical protein ILUMI_25250 [Ignelater luminosus]
MISKVIALVTVIFSFVDFSTGLNCHGCMTSTTSDCVDGVEASYFIHPCVPEANRNNSLGLFANGINLKIGPKTEDNLADLTLMCTRIAYRDTNTGSKIFVRGCGGISGGEDFCKLLENALDIIGCSWCDQDYCNDEPGWD